VLLTPVIAQSPPDGPTFDVVSIKRVDELRQNGGMRMPPLHPMRTWRSMMRQTSSPPCKSSLT